MLRLKVARAKHPEQVSNLSETLLVALVIGGEVHVQVSLGLDLGDVAKAEGFEPQLHPLHGGQALGEGGGARTGGTPQNGPGLGGGCVHFPGRLCMELACWSNRLKLFQKLLPVYLR